MLTAITVLVILMAIIFSMMGLTFRLTDSTTRGGDSSQEALQVLDRIGEDVAGMLIRPDVDQYYFNTTGNDKMFFYSQTAGYFAGTPAPTQQSPLSLVGYRITSSANPSLPPQLERISQGLNWTEANALPLLVFTPLSPPITPPVNPILSRPQVAAGAANGTIPLTWPTQVNGATSFWHVISGQVFRFEVCYQLRDGTYTLQAPTPSTPPNLPNNGTQPIAPVAGDINDTIGLVVAIAVLDAKSRQLIPAPPNPTWASLIAALPDPSANDLGSSPAKLMDSTWNSQINSSGFAQTAGIPAMAAAQIRVYQRYYPLNVPLSR